MVAQNAPQWRRTAQWTATLLALSTIAMWSCAVASSPRAPVTTCAVSAPGKTLQLSCDSGDGGLLSSLSIGGAVFARYGQLLAGSSCAAGRLQGNSNCSAALKAAVDRLCAGHTKCDLQCACPQDLTTTKDRMVLGTRFGTTPCQCQAHGHTIAFPPFECDAAGASSVAVKVDCVTIGPPPAPLPQPGSTSPTRLHLSGLPSPVLGVDTLRPSFAWQPNAPTNYVRPAPVDAQSAFEVNVYSVLSAGTQLLLSSGVVASTTPRWTPATPLALTSDHQYEWEVRVYRAGASAPSGYSSRAQFSTGLLQQGDWQAQWITGGKLLRHDFDVPATVQPSRVSIFVSACQYYELFLDGSQVGNSALDVVWTYFAANRSYATHSVASELLAPGSHTLGLRIGDGFCGSGPDLRGSGQTRGALLQMHVHTSASDAVSMTVATSSTWQAGNGTILFDNTYYGEDVDARLAQPGWSTPSFLPKSGTWVNASLQFLPPEQPPVMSSQMQPPIRAIETRPPVGVTKLVGTYPPRWTYDFGQQVTGWSRLQLPANTAAGTNVTLSHGEVLAHPPLPPRNSQTPMPYNGTVYRGNLFWANPIDSYTAAGGSSSGESWEPSFTYHGFRYVELSSNQPLPLASGEAPVVEAVVARTDARVQTTMSFGNVVLQSISNNSWWTESAGLMGIPAGCAARGERNGWTADGGFAAEPEMVDFDTEAFHAQWAKQFIDNQCLDGSLNNGVPQASGPLAGNCTADATWGSAYPMVVHDLWRYYGSTDVVEINYDAVARYMNYLERNYNETGLSTFLCKWGDWNPAVRGDLSCHITAAASFILDAQRMYNMAVALGKSADATHYKALNMKLLSEFHGAFWNNQTQQYGAGMQTEAAVALYLGVVPADLQSIVLGNLTTDINRNGMTGGFQGALYVYDALTISGRTDVAISALLRLAYPGYGYEILNTYEPGTSLWESWDGDTMRQWVDESSRNHHYQTSIQTYLRRVVAGLETPLGQDTAWSTVIAKPTAATLEGDLAMQVPWAGVRVDARLGVVSVSWARYDTNNMTEELLFELNVTIPAGATGEVHVPANFASTEAQLTVTESSQTIWRDGAFVASASPGVLSGQMESQFVKFTTNSGHYTFAIPRVQAKQSPARPYPGGQSLKRLQR